MARIYLVILLVGGSFITGFAQENNSPNQHPGLPSVHPGQNPPQPAAYNALWNQEGPPASEPIQTSAEQDLRGPALWDRSNADRQTTISVGALKLSGKARAALSKALAAVGKKKLADAARYVERALELCPKSAEALTFRAALKAQDINSRQDAREDAEKAVEYDPNYWGGYIILGSIYTSTGKFDDAIRTLDRGIALMPTHWAGYYELSIALLGKQDYVGGLRQAEKASRLEARNYPPLHLVKAYAYIGMKNRSAAAAELTTFQSLDPSSPLLAPAKKTFDEMLPASRDAQLEIHP